MADFSNNVGSNIVFNADSFKIDDKLSKGAKYVSSNSSSSGSDVETVDFDEWDNQKKGSNSSSGVRSNFVYQKVGQDVEHNGNADHDAWEKQREEEEKKPLTDYFSNYIDINHDGKVDKDDLRYFTGELKSNSVDEATLKLYGDINGDSVFDENDKMIIQSYINGEDVTQSVDMDYLSFKKSVIDSSKNKNIDIAGALDQKDFNYESSDESILKIYFEKNADFNGDGKIDKEDVRLFNLGSNEVSNISSDFNGDGKVDEKDRKLFSKYVNGENVADQINKNAALAAAYKKDFNAYNKQATDLAAYKKELVDAKNKADQEGGGGEEEFKRQYGMSYDEYNKFIKVIDKRINNINYKKKSANVKYKKYVEKNNIAGDLKDFKHDTSAYWQKIDYEGLYKYYKKGGRLADYPDILKLYEAGEGVDWYAIIEYFQIEKGELLKDSTRGLPYEYKCFNAMTDEQIKKYHDIFKNKGDEAAEEYIGELNKDDKLIYGFEKAEGEAGCAFFVKYDHYKFLSDDQKKYFKYLHDTKGKAAAEEYLASVEPFEGMKRRIEDNSIDKINQRTDEDFVKSYLKKKADYNGDGKIDIKDYQKLMNIHSNYVDIKDANTDLNGDGLFNSADLELLNNYLKSGDISGIVGSYDYIKYKAKEQLAEYKKYRDNLEDAAEKIRNYDLDDLSETDRENMLNEISEQITMFNSLIISQKKVVDRLPYLNLTYTDDYKKFDKNYVEKLKNNKKLEEIYKNYKENPLYGFPDGVDKLEIIDYLINIKGEDPETVLSKFGEETKYYRYLTDDQQMMYHYLYKTKGAEAAEKYAKVLEDDIIRQEAMDEIKSQIDALDIKIERDKDGNIIKQSLDSTAWNELNAMLKGFGEGITDDFNSISKWGKDGYTKDEYKKMYYLQYLQSNGLLEGLYNGGKIAGNLTRSIAISTAITLAFPENMATTAALVAAGVNTAISTAAAGAEAQHSALVEGYSTKTANEYAKQIMTNNVVLDLTSTAIGYGIVPTIQFSNAIRGVSTISKAARYSTTLVNTLSGSAIAALSVHRQQRLREVYLNKSTIDADQESEAMVNAFIQSMVMAAVSSGINKTFTVIKNGVKKKLSTNDYLEYTKNADNPSEEGFVKTQFDESSGDPHLTKLITKKVSSSGKSAAALSDDSSTSKYYSKIDSTVDDWTIRIIEDDISNAYWDGTKDSIEKFLKFNSFESDSINVNRYIKGEGNIDIDGLANAISKAHNEDYSYVRSMLVDYNDKNPVVVNENKIITEGIKTGEEVKKTALKRVNEVADPDAYIDEFSASAKKWDLRKKNNFDSNTNFDDIVNSAYYKRYVNGIIGEKRCNQVLDEFFPNGAKEAKVYAFQPQWAFEEFTLGGKTLGRGEGYYVISESELSSALSKASGGRKFSSNEINDFISGNVSLDFDKKTFAEALGFKSDYFEKGAVLTEATVTRDSVRFSLATDEGANARYTPGLSTSGGANEMLAKQITDVNFEEQRYTTGQQQSDGVWMDRKNKVRAVKIVEPKKNPGK